jgi:hypothetical protein
LFLRGRFTGNAEAFVGPLPEVEQSTSFRAKGAIGVSCVIGQGSAGWTFNLFHHSILAV